MAADAANIVHTWQVTAVCWLVLLVVILTDKALRKKGNKTGHWALACAMPLATGGSLPWFLVGFGPGDGIGNEIVLIAGLFVTVVGFTALFASRAD